MNPSHQAWGRNIVIVYTAFALATLGFVAFAITQRVDLTSEHYYEDALVHDQTMIARQRAAKAGSEISWFNDELTVTLPNDPTVQEGMVITLLRPDNPAMDQQIRAVAVGGGHYRVMTNAVQPGTWVVRAVWQSEGVPFRLDSRIRIQRP